MKCDNMPESSRKRVRILAAAAFSAVAFLCLYLGYCIQDPNGNFLYSKDGSWIKDRTPLILETRPYTADTAVFRAAVNVSTLPREAVLHFRAFRAAAIWVDDQCVYRNDSFLDWNREKRVSLLPWLSAGHHVLTVQVKNNGGPPALTAVCHELGIRTGGNWEVSHDGLRWEKALSADTILPPESCRDFPGSGRAFVSALGLYLPLFLVALILLDPAVLKRFPAGIRATVSPADTAKRVMLCAYFVLAVNNIFRLPVFLGMDHRGHLAYIQYIAENMRLPLANEGWSMFEPPLYYSLSAFFYRILAVFLPLEAVFRALRVIPLLCGAIQIEVCSRALKIVYPGREDLRLFGILIGGLLPVNIYISQFPGTEPLAGCLMAIVVLLSLKMLNSPAGLRHGFYVALGAFLGLALLSKITAFLLIPPVILSILMLSGKTASGDGNVPRTAVIRCLVVLGVAGVLSGWFYIRNYVELGRIVVGASGGGYSSGFNNWWQDPGYRTVSQLMFTGRALLQPVYAGVYSLWDGLYASLWSDSVLSGKTIYPLRPPWNYDCMLSGVLLACLPSAAIITGLLSIFRRRTERERSGSVLFSAGCVLIFIAAILFQYLTIPIYSIGKAKYLLGIVPCLAVLGAEGFDRLPGRSDSRLRTVLLAVLICWGAGVYSAYFAGGQTDEMKMADHYKLYVELLQKERPLEAADQLIAIRRVNAGAVPADNDLIRALDLNARAAADGGDCHAALSILKRLRELQPEIPVHDYNTACIYSRMGEVDDAVFWLDQAVKKGFRDWELMKRDPDLINIRETPLMRTLSDPPKQY